MPVFDSSPLTNVAAYFFEPLELYIVYFIEGGAAIDMSVNSPLGKHLRSSHQPPASGQTGVTYVPLARKRLRLDPTESTAEVHSNATI